ncbi:DedA family protein [Agilicoccus flavus]|uniref:DedA family protein n=1 Tax=Agilicoccus flavus TaxID=2775968 RepID=UPI001CF66D38|nr:VTT domain-containing protein [Agilicoccus flavus]
MVTAYGVVSLPARPLLLGLSPDLLAVVTGSRMAVVAMGVLARAEGGWYLWPLLASMVSIAKFHWVFWWAGRIWGHDVLVRLAGDGPAARRRIARAEALVRRFSVWALVLAYVPLPLPREILHAALGIAGVRLRTFLLVDLAAAVVSQALFFLAGYLVGEPVVPLLREYARWAGLVSLAVLALMGLRWWRGRAAARSASERVSRPPTP